MSKKGEKTHRYQIRLQEGTADDLSELAAGLGFFVNTLGRYHGNPSPGDFLDTLVEKFREDPAALMECLRQAGVVGEGAPTG